MTHPTDPNSEIALSIVIPVYRGRETIRLVVEGLLGTLSQKDGLEVILVDDASPDNAWEVLQQLHQECPDRVRIIQLMRNFGQHNAIMCGLRHARGDVIITMDDDGQHPPEEIPRLLQTLEQTGADVVYGVPRNRQHAWWRNLGSWLVIRFFQVALNTRVVPSAFRAMRREVVDAITRYPYHFTHIDGLVIWNTLRIAQVEVEHRPRAAGRSSYSLSKLLLLAINVFTNFSLLPLQVASVFGFFAAVGGLLLGTFYLVMYLLGRIAVPGYASTIVAVLVLGGLQMLSLGIIGEYLGRVHLNINRRPQYTVRKILQKDA
ncbi:MAG: glycosyltransferase family 2 protein [Thermogutta sp.]